MRIVIVGNPQSGQQQLFSILTGITLDSIAQKPLEIHKGICDVRDPRIQKLSQMYKPKKTTFARIEYLLLPDFNLQGPAKTLVFNELKNADEICWVSKNGSAKEDVGNFISELVISDLMLIEKRLETIQKEQKKKYSEVREKESNLMLRCKKVLDGNGLLKGIEANTEEDVLLRTYQFLTLKPAIAVVNCDSENATDKALESSLVKEYNMPVVCINATLEEEIRQMPENEREEFMKELGIEEPAVDKMTRMVFTGLGLISFFTVGEDEVRAWPVKKGSSAPEAGGSIHSDIAKGFVRAEMFKYADLMSSGSEAKLKETGKFYLKGRDYIVEDADILNFRFNV
ncbi:MAG: DUF933 domain-containing protein [Candidatus Margulisiibacteriota bacterium]